MARKRKAAVELYAAEPWRGTEEAALRDARAYLDAHWEETAEGWRPRGLAEPLPLAPRVFAELSRMADVGAGGNCVLYRRPPAVTTEVEEEVCRLLMDVPGARKVSGLSSYCFEREAAEVLFEVMKGVAR